jgi:hypothetical protein
MTGFLREAGSCFYKGLFCGEKPGSIHMKLQWDMFQLEILSKKVENRAR